LYSKESRARRDRDLTRHTADRRAWKTRGMTRARVSSDGSSRSPRSGREGALSSSWLFEDLREGEVDPDTARGIAGVEASSSGDEAGEVWQVLNVVDVSRGRDGAGPTAEDGECSTTESGRRVLKLTALRGRDGALGTLVERARWSAVRGIEEVVPGSKILVHRRKTTTVNALMMVDRDGVTPLGGRAPGITETWEKDQKSRAQALSAATAESETSARAPKFISTFDPSAQVRIRVKASSSVALPSISSVARRLSDVRVTEDTSRSKPPSSPISKAPQPPSTPSEHQPNPSSTVESSSQAVVARVKPKLPPKRRLSSADVF
jgi:hypothetical protein